MVGEPTAPQAVEGDSVQLLCGENISRHPFVDICQICYSIVALSYFCGVEVVTSFGVLGTEKRNCVCVVCTCAFDNRLGLGQSEPLIGLVCLTGLAPQAIDASAMATREVKRKGKEDFIIRRI